MDKNQFSRRDWLKTGAALSAAAAVVGKGYSAEATASAAASNSVTQGLAHEYTVAARLPGDFRLIHDPGMTVLPGGRILAASPAWKRVNEGHLILSRSSDRGRTWEELPSLPYVEATPFVARDALYMFTQYKQHQGVYFIRSDDEGETWTKPSKVLEGPFWNCQTNMVQRDGYLYWSMDARHQDLYAIAGDLDKDLLDPAAWRISNSVRLPEIPDAICRRLNPPAAKSWHGGWPRDVWLEANVVAVGERLRLAARVVPDEYSTSHLAGICDLQDDGKDLNLQFTQFYPWPGGQNKFSIQHDEKTGMFWMASNLVTNSQDLLGLRDKILESPFLGGPGNERRFLYLWYGLDALNWFPAGLIAMWPKLCQSFMYPAMQIDGDDLVLLSRTSKGGRHQHDADLSPFHRIANFRELAVRLNKTFLIAEPMGEVLSICTPPPTGSSRRRQTADPIAGRSRIALLTGLLS